MRVHSTDYSFTAPSPIGEHEYMKLKQLFIVSPEAEIPGPPRYFMHPDHEGEKNLYLACLAAACISIPFFDEYVFFAIIGGAGIMIGWWGLLIHFITHGFSYMLARQKAIAYNRRLKQAIIESPNYEYFRRTFYQK